MEEGDLTNWLLSALIMSIAAAVFWEMHRRSAPPPTPSKPVPKRPSPPSPIHDKVKAKLDQIQRLSDPALSRNSGEVFSCLTPEILEIIKGYEANVAKFSQDMEDYALKLRETK